MSFFAKMKQKESQTIEERELALPCLEREAVSRRLGVPPDRALPQRFARLVDALWPSLFQAVRPRMAGRSYSLLAAHRGQLAVTEEVSFSSPLMAHSLRYCHRVILFLVTLGDRLDSLIERQVKEDAARGFILDAMAGVLTESLAQSAQRFVEESLLSPQERATLRFSPGYCDWEIGEQRLFFSLWPASPLGLSLTSSSLMVPKKSISALFGVQPCQAPPPPNPCERCSQKDCPSRRQN